MGGSNQKKLKDVWDAIATTWENSSENYGKTIHKKLLVKFLGDVTNKKILEIGCGDGRYLKFLQERGAYVIGLDISDVALSLAKKRGQVIKADARNLPFKSNVFDAVFSFGVVEHFDETQKAINEHQRVTKKDGIIIISVPNIFSPYNILAALWHIKKGTWRMRPASYGKRFTLKQLKSMLEKSNNTEVIELSGLNIFPIYFSFLNRIGFISRLAELELKLKNISKIIALMIVAIGKKRR